MQYNPTNLKAEPRMRREKKLQGAPKWLQERSFNGCATETSGMVTIKFQSDSPTFNK